MCTKAPGYLNPALALDILTPFYSVRAKIARGKPMLLLGNNAESYKQRLICVIKTVTEYVNSFVLHPLGIRMSFAYSLFK
jgi:hypothetical protein